MMPALPPTQTLTPRKPMSALCQKRTFARLLDQLVGACEQWQGYCQAERLGCLEVDEGKKFPGGFKKTEISDRQFCTRCGGHIMTHHPTFGLTDVGAALLPAIAFKPVIHLHYAETVLPMKDGLPKLRDFPAEAGGSGELVPE